MIFFIGICFVLIELGVCSPLKIESNNDGKGCMYENITYSPGDKFKPNPCTFCHCPHNGGNTQCAIVDCLWESNCLEYQQAEGHCCGTCKRYGCKHTDGKVYNPGDVIPASHCGKCYCPEEGGAIVCNKPSCPKLDCADVIHKEGHCCPVCPDHDGSCYAGDTRIPRGKVMKLEDCKLCYCPLEYSTEKDIQAICTIGDCS